MHATRVRKHGSIHGDLSLEGAPPRGVDPAILLEAYSTPVPEAGCHLWLRSTRGSGPGFTEGRGYGYLSVDGRRVQAHVLAYKLRHGPIPEGAIVRHKCDTPPCVNPDHLELGSHGDNARDRDSRGRARIGVDHHNAKLNPDLVSLARGLHREGVATTEIALRLKVSPGTAWEVVKGRTWKHVHEGASA